MPEQEQIQVTCDGHQLEVLDKFCYLGDTIGARGGAEDSVTTRIRSAWGKFRELLPVLTGKSFPLLTKGKIYQACVRSVMLYGCETWPVKEEDMKRLESNDNRMIRWMYGVSLREQIPSHDLRNRLSLSSIQECVQIKRLEWFGHLERMEDTAWANKCRDLQINGRTGRGRPKTTWNEVVKRDLKARGLNKDLAQDRITWKSNIKQCPTHASMENGQ